MKPQRHNDMKTLKSIFAFMMLLLAVTSCEKDGDNIYLSSPEGGALTATTSDVVLTKDLRSTIVLSLAFPIELIINLTLLACISHFGWRKIRMVAISSAN